MACLFTIGAQRGPRHGLGDFYDTIRSAYAVQGQPKNNSSTFTATATLFPGAAAAAILIWHNAGRDEKQADDTGYSTEAAAAAAAIESNGRPNER